MVHRAKRHHVRVLELAESGLGLGLGAVGGHDLGGGPGVAVGEQDPLAEQAAFQPAAGGGVDGEAQAQVGGLVAGEGDGHDLTDPARFADGGDLGLHRGAGPAGVAPGQPFGEGGKALLRLGQGLVEATRLGGVQGLGVGQYRPAGHPQRGDRGVDVGQAGKPVRIDAAVAAAGDGEQVGVVAGWQRPDEPDPGRLDAGVVVGGVLPGVVDQGQRVHATAEVPIAGHEFVHDRGELGDVRAVARIGVRE